MHHSDHAFANYYPLAHEGLVVGSRRNMLKAGFAGIAGLSLPQLLKAREAASDFGKPMSRKSVILL